MLIEIPELEKKVKEILLTEYSQEETELLKEVVMFGELSGRPTHGLIRLIKGNYGAFAEEIREKPQSISKTKVSTLIDGNNNVGMLVASLAMKEVIKLTKENGIGIVGTKRSVNSTGSLSYYLEKIAKENLIGIIFTQSPPVIAPFNLKKALFGSNPIGFTIPSYPQPIIFDMSTSAITYGSIMKAKMENKELPENVALDKNGNTTTNPSEAAEGATLPFDNSYKGSGLAMIVELLAAVWNGAGYETLHQENGCGNLFLALSPDLLSDTETLKHNAEEFIEVLRGSVTRDGSIVRIPGENTLKIYHENIAKGEIEINDIIWSQLQ